MSQSPPQLGGNNSTLNNPKNTALSTFNPKAKPKPGAVASAIPGSGYQPPKKTPPPVIMGPNIKDLPPARQKQIAAAGAAEHIRNMQQFLKNRGYNINVDGIRGPQTNAIVAAFHNHVTPAQLAAKAGGGNTHSGVSTPPPVVHSSAGGSTGGGGGGKTKTHPAAVPAVAPAPDPSVVDPYAYAKSATNAEYDPQIAAQQAALAGLDPQHAQNNADLTSWYGQLAKLITGQQKQEGIDNTAQLSQYDTAANNAVGQLFGGGAANPAASEAMAFHDIGDTSLRGEDNAQAAFLANMKPILQAQGNDALRAEMGSYSKSKSGLQQAIAALQGAKGQAYTANLATGQNQALQARTAQQSLALATKLAPYQVQTAQAQATTAQTQANTAAATAKANLALVNANVAKAQAAAVAAGGKWNLTNPSDRGALSQALRTSISNQQGYLRVSPQIALQNIQQALVQAGLGDDAQAKAIADSVFQEVLNNSHSAKLWRHVTYAGGKLTVKKAKKK